jgi:TetR/AcrR family tetracycline transcriptional repressor
VALSKDLSGAKIVDTALVILAEQGLAALSMRRVADALGVAPGALYWHVESKQELLAQAADRILSGVSAAQGASRSVKHRIRDQALAIRAALLTVRDGAEVVSFALALRPLEHSPVAMLHQTLATALPEPEAEWGAQTLAHYILGEVAEEQNRAELTRAGILVEDRRAGYSSERFLFCIQVILNGLTA